MSFYSAACYVFAYGWGQGQPIVLSDLPIGSKYSRTLFLHTHAVGRAIHSTSLSRPVAFTVAVLNPLPAHTNLLRFGRLSHRHGQDACPVPKRHRCRHQPAWSYPSLADIPCALLDVPANMPKCLRTVTPWVLIRLTRKYHHSIRAVLMPPHVSCGHDAVARARKTDRGLFDPEIRPFIPMCYI